MEATLLCSTGLLLRHEHSAVLFDVLNGTYGSFKQIDRPTARQLIDGTIPDNAQIDGLFYSHLHPDHYDQSDNAAFLQSHPTVSAFFPTPETPDHGILRAGAFTVEYQYHEHMHCDYVWAKHYTFLVQAGETSCYLTTDAELSPEKHRAFLRGRRADYGFFNAVYLSYPETRQLLRDAARHVCIYHMPEPDTDESGICRKAARNLERFGAELPNVTILEQYPTQLQL